MYIFFKIIDTNGGIIIKLCNNKSECFDNSKSDCSCNHTHNHSNHHSSNHTHNHSHDNNACACESGILSDIDSVEDESNNDLYKIIIGIILFLIGFAISKFTYNSLGSIIINNYSMNSSQLISIIFFILVILIIGFDIIKYGLSELLEYEVKIEFLVTISTIGACLLGNFAEGAILMLLFFVAEYLEDFALDQSKKSMVDLVKLRPDIACVKKEGYEIEVKVEELSIGDIVIVKPGDKVPIDGVIIKGSSSINQASITGESFPVDKSVGDEVYSSTINQEGYFEFKVTKTSDETIFSKIIELIKESEDKKAKIDLFIDKFAKYYTPTIIILAILVAIIPYLIFGLSFKEWIYKSLVLLVISCPCALAISTPVSMVSAITAGTKNGIIIKGGEYIEELSKIKAISFDKTGTLTEGNLVIEDIKTFNGVCVEDLMKIICSIENNSNHPIAKLFKDYSIENNILISELDEFNSINGLGLEGSIDGVNYLVGKKELIGMEVIGSHLDIPLSNIHVFIAQENNLIGFISLSDKIRSNTKSTISNLSKKSIKTFMLTGDNEDNAFKVANTIGIDNYYSNLMPKDKVQKV